MAAPSLLFVEQRHMFHDDPLFIYYLYRLE